MQGREDLADIAEEKQMLQGNVGGGCSRGPGWLGSGWEVLRRQGPMTGRVGSLLGPAGCASLNVSQSRGGKKGSFWNMVEIILG